MELYKLVLIQLSQLGALDSSFSHFTLASIPLRFVLKTISVPT